ncbi:MAG TPA: GH25 family lysozyme [Sporichthyaceae bacterium]|jgi:hypothetical protein
MADLAWNGEEQVVAALVPVSLRAPRPRPRSLTALGPLVAAGLALVVLTRVAAPDVLHIDAATAPPPLGPVAPVALPAPVMLSESGPYVGPDVAKRQQDFANPGRSAQENMNAGLLDPAKMIADGMDFEFAKASQGTWFTDDYFAVNRARAQQAGLLFGAYHYLEKGNGVAQADAFFQRLQETGGAAGVMLMVDVEWKDEAETSGPSYADITDFCARLRELVPGRQIVVYTLSRYWGKAGKSGALGNPPAPEGTVLNWASYLDGTAPVEHLAGNVAAPGTAEDPYQRNSVGTWGSYTFRQFTSTATYAQYKHQKMNHPDAGQSTLDFNISFASRDQLLALAGLSSVDAVAPIRGTGPVLSAEGAD